jgi:hypothetical protein
VQHKHDTALTDTSYFRSQLLARLSLRTFLVGLDVVPWEWSIFQALLLPPPPQFRLLVFIAAQYVSSKKFLYAGLLSEL